MRGLGLRSELMLKQADIQTPEELREIGVVAAYRALKFFVGSQVSLNFLWAIEGALTDQDWRYISAERKAELKILVQHGDG